MDSTERSSSSWRSCSTPVLDQMAPSLYMPGQPPPQKLVPRIASVMISMRFHFKLAALSLVGMVSIFCQLTAGAALDKPADYAALSAAICPIVYPLDQLPT